MTMRVRFTADDPYGLWEKEDVAEDMGWESTLELGMRLLRMEKRKEDPIGELLSLYDPFGRGLIEEIT